MKKAGIQAFAALTINIEPAVAQISGLMRGRLTRFAASRAHAEPTKGDLAPVSRSVRRTTQTSSSPGGPDARKAQRHPQCWAIKPPTRNARKAPTGLPVIATASADVARRGK